MSRKNFGHRSPRVKGFAFVLYCNLTKNKVRAGLLVDLVTFKGCSLNFFSKEMKPPPTEEARHSPQPQGETSPWRSLTLQFSPLG